MPCVTEAQAKPRKVRKECSYTTEERAILAKYKEEYLATTSHQQRDQLLRGEVFCDMFNYWHGRDGVDLTEEETSTRQKVRSIKMSHRFSHVNASPGAVLLDPKQLALEEVSEH